jgi:hypothetical protein
MFALYRNKRLVIGTFVIVVVLLVAPCTTSTATAASPAGQQTAAPTGPSAIGKVTPNPAAGQVLKVYNPAGIRKDGKYIDDLLKQVMDASGGTRPPLAAQFPHVRVEDIAITKDALAEINELFYKRGWSDGLPIVPPTEERVQDMLRGTDLSPDTVVSPVGPKLGLGTVEKIAVNAVMAGCRAEYMPVLIAAVKAIAQESFQIGPIATTTGNDSPLVIVSGPIARQLGISSGPNCLGRGWRANATIGRALHLIINNIGGSWPGVNDMSPLGQPMEFANCLAEADAAGGNHWGYLAAAELGYAPNANVVTVITVESYQAIISIEMKSEDFLKKVAGRIAGLGRTEQEAMLFILNADFVDIANRDGWTRNKIKKYLIDNSGVKVDKLLILVAGGPPGEKNMMCPTWKGSIGSAEIKLPGNWEALLKEVKE